MVDEGKVRDGITTIIINIIIISGIIFYQGKTMVDEGEVREGKGGGSVVCYRGAWLPKVIVITIIIMQCRGLPAWLIAQFFINSR